MLSLYNSVDYMSRRPVRVSTQAVRDHDHSHFHEVIQLCFVLSGELRHVINGKEYIQTAGSCAFLLPYMGHELDATISSDTPVIAYVWFRESFLRDAGIPFLSISDAAHFEGKKIPEVYDFGEDAEVATALMRRMINEFDKNQDMSLDILRSSLTELFRLACNSPQEKKAASLLKEQYEGVSKAILYMREHYPEKLNLDMLSEVAGMSRRSFTSHFKAITGFSPNMFLISVRLSNVVVSLYGNEALRDEIARSCGLYDHSNLARIFKKYVGMSPTEFNNRRILSLYMPHQKSIRARFPWLAEEAKNKE